MTKQLKKNEIDVRLAELVAALPETAEQRVLKVLAVCDEVRDLSERDRADFLESMFLESLSKFQHRRYTYSLLLRLLGFCFSLIAVRRDISFWDQ